MCEKGKEGGGDWVVVVVPGVKCLVGGGGGDIFEIITPLIKARAGALAQKMGAPRTKLKFESGKRKKGLASGKLEIFREDRTSAIGKRVRKVPDSGTCKHQ